VRCCSRRIGGRVGDISPAQRASEIIVMRTNKLLLLAALSLVFVGCGGASENATLRAEEPANQPMYAEGQSAADERPAARAERREERREERSEAEPREEITAQDQTNDEGDVRITQDIRQRVVGHDDLSFGAKNCTIVTRAGVVTLRGEVDSAQERTIIATLARGATGVRSVDDQLTVDAD